MGSGAPPTGGGPLKQAADSLAKAEAEKGRLQSELDTQRVESQKLQEKNKLLAKDKDASSDSAEMAAKQLKQAADSLAKAEAENGRLQSELGYAARRIAEAPGAE